MSGGLESHLRRLEDEPLAIPDRVLDHVARCRRCRARQAQVAAEALCCGRLLGGPQPVADPDAGWARMRQEIAGSGATGGGRRRDPVVGAHRGPRLLRISLRRGLAAGAAAVVLAGTAAAATITTVFAPTHVAPVTLTNSGVSALASFMGLGSPGTATAGTTPSVLGGFPTTSGSRTTSFGTVQWSSPSAAHEVPTLADATKEVGFTVALPKVLPAGVVGPQRLVVQPRVEVTVTFDSHVAEIGGSSVVLASGPAVLAVYGSSAGGSIPTLGILSMPRPQASASGATMGRIEAFLLDQPGLPASLVQEIRLLGDLGTTLPVPVPAGALERGVEIGGSPGVLVADPSRVAAGVVWEDGAGMLHAVAGLVDQKEVLGVADQLG